MDPGQAHKKTRQTVAEHPPVCRVSHITTSEVERPEGIPPSLFSSDGYFEFWRDLPPFLRLRWFPFLGKMTRRR